MAGLLDETFTKDTTINLYRRLGIPPLQLKASHRRHPTTGSRISREFAVSIDVLIFPRVLRQPLPPSKAKTKSEASATISKGKSVQGIDPLYSIF
jgi:hypothetical protein